MRERHVLWSASNVGWVSSSGGSAAQQTVVYQFKAYQQGILSIPEFDAIDDGANGVR